MNSDKRISRGKMAHRLLVLLLACTFLVGVNQPAIYASLTADQRAGAGQVEPVNSLKVSASPPSALVLAATATPKVRTYLPFVIKTKSSSPTPTPTSSSGTSCNPTRGSGGLAPGLYQTTVAGLNATVVVGNGYNSKTPTYLAFYAHGDNGNVDLAQFRSTSNDVVKFVTQRGWIFVAPQSPNGGESWWTNWNGDHNAAFAKVLDAMFAKYNVCRNIVFGASGSGGSEFWTAYFFPEKGGTYPAHMVIGCGGNRGHDTTARQQIVTLGKNPTVVARSSFEYVYGTDDSLYPLIIRSIAAYTSAGFHVDTAELQGAGHCNQWLNEGLPRLSQQIATRWTRLATEFGAH